MNLNFVRELCSRRERRQRSVNLYARLFRQRLEPRDQFSAAALTDQVHTDVQANYESGLIGSQPMGETAPSSASHEGPVRIDNMQAENGHRKRRLFAASTGNANENNEPS